ncbi:MAG: translation initiation factor IF-2 [Candidatus Micrarchaeota archaeon]|nr:translation initiation factor IF-2 [Candidatus Micrarchaeota archaeon]
MIRQPIVAVLGHVDHGKTSLLDAIRKTSVQKRESGGITQHIGASEVPAETIREICGPLLEQLKIEVKIPGLLFIDTPGHVAFTNLRKRGGSIADIAVLVIDIMQGIQPQTREAMEILKEFKTPFIVAANKVDMIDGWKAKGGSFFASFAQQNEIVRTRTEDKFYALVGRLHDYGFEAERFDRVEDFTKTVAIIPTSATKGEGIPELLISLTGLSQKYLGKRLDIEVSGPGKASILEVKEEKGLGNTIDVVLYDGTLKRNDLVVFGTANGASSTKIRALLKPKPLDEIRDPREKFDYVDEAYAAAGVKIFAPGLQDALAGSQLLVAEGNEEELKLKISQEIKSLFVNTGGAGVILKTDALGSLEAITKMIEKEGIKIRKAEIGKITKLDVVEASAVRAENEFLGVILAFNVSAHEEADEEAKRLKVPIMHEKVIYQLIDGYKEWVRKEKEREKTTAFASLVLPGKFKVLRGCCFRMSKPAIFGVEILRGIIKPDYEVVNSENKFIGKIKAIQDKKESLPEAKKGMQIAVSMNEPTIGRQVCEDDVLYVRVPKSHRKILLEKFAENLTDEEKALLEEIAAILEKEG